MQNDMVSVDTSALREIVTNMNSQKEELIKIYNSIIKPVLESSKECIKVSGIDFEEVEQLFATIFNNVSYNVNNLSNELTNKIIPNYENVNNQITGQ